MFARDDFARMAEILTGIKGRFILSIKDRPEIRYPLKVPYYIEDAWSYCSPPRENEKADAAKFIEKGGNPGERFEAVCRIQVDNETVVRGLITSVPRL